MTIWELTIEIGYNIAILVDRKGNMYHEKCSDYFKDQNDPFIRDFKIKVTEEGFSDVMTYIGVGGAFVVNAKVRQLIETYFGNLSIQFLPCFSKQFPDIDPWIMNVCEYHDVLDVPNCICRTGLNIDDKEVIMSIKRNAFTKAARELDIFKIYVNNEKNCFHLFVSDRFKSIMEENGVTGFALEKVYSI